VCTVQAVRVNSDLIAIEDGLKQRHQQKKKERQEVRRNVGVYVPCNLGILEIACWGYAITIEPFKFPLYIKVRDVRNKLLQLCRHLQCRACILKPLHQGLLGSLPTRRNSLHLGLGMGTERFQSCRVPPFKASPSRKVLNSLLLVISDALTPLAHYVRKLRKVSRLAVQS